MYYSISMAMINSSKQFIHNLTSLTLIEHLILLRGNPIEKFSPRAILHHQVNVLRVIISLIILDYVGMVQLSQYRNLFLNLRYIILQLALIEHLYRYFKGTISDGLTQENFPKSTCS